MLKSYKELIVWQKSTDLVLEIYELTREFPKEELYNITSQIRRSSVSIPSNIAEGYSRGHRQEYLQFLRIAFASGAELETQLILAEKLSLSPNKKFRKSNEILVEVMKMLNVLIGTIKNKA
jgi:four helix bundle protein